MSGRVIAMLASAASLLATGCDTPGGGGGAGLPVDATRATDGTDAAAGSDGSPTGDAATDGAVEPATYTATQDAGGERCGSDGQDWVECAPRDGCLDPDANLCAVVTGDYHAWTAGGGQRCGLNDLGTLHTYCVPRDTCVDQDAPFGVCQRQSGPQYPAYKSADGEACGEEGWFFVYCEPGDTCVSEDTNRCE